MEIVNIVAIGVVTSIIVILLKQIKSELSLLVGIIGAILIILYTFSYFTDIFSNVNTIVEKTQIDFSVVRYMLKIVCIGYIAEFGANICSDAGSSLLAEKILFGGKIIIFAYSMPIINNLIDILVGLL